MDLISIEQQKRQTFQIQVRKHRLLVDMPPEEGGSDDGPRPTELFVASFGVCVGMALARYCETIGCGQDIEIYLTYQLADKPRRVEAIVVDVELPEGFPENRRSAVDKVIRSCPVHNTLVQPPRIDIEIA
jgi:uncharacterized OsmC-like protein